MTRTGEAVVADNAIGDEVAGAGCYVVQAHRLAERLDRNDAQLGIALDGLPMEVQLAGDGRARRVEETELLAESAFETDHIDRLSICERKVFDNKLESERRER